MSLSIFSSVGYRGTGLGAFAGNSYGALPIYSSACYSGINPGALAVKSYGEQLS